MEDRSVGVLESWDLRFSMDDLRLGSGCRPFVNLQSKIDNGLGPIIPSFHSSIIPPAFLPSVATCGPVR